MLPDPYDTPPCIGQEVVSFSVPSHVPIEFLLPPGSIGLGHSSMVWASMPPAPVNEHRYPLSGEDHVGLTADSGHWTAMNPVPKAPAV